MKTAKLFIRIAIACLLFFLIGHGLGHLNRHYTTDPVAMEVQRQMTDNKFDMFGTMRSYDENYSGMSLNLIITLASLSMILWFLSTAVQNESRIVRLVLFPIFICVLGFAVTSWIYFFPMPAITCFVASFFICGAIIKLS